MSSLFSSLPALLDSEFTETIIRSGQLRIERIVSQGHASPGGFWYDQKENEFVMVCQGAARLQFVDEAVELKPGDWINIPAHRKHRVEWTAPDETTVWLAVFYK